MNSDIGSIRHDFSELSYVSLLEALHERGYSFVGFHHKGGPDEAQVILRHDVDVDLQSAVKLAEIEAELQVSSTFFILCSSELYNVNSLSGRIALRRLVQLGHQIGVHFDPSIYDGTAMGGYDSQILREKDFLEDICGADVSVFSLHKPGVGVDLLQSGETGMLNAYDDAFYKDIAYVSDSMGWWRFGHPLDQAFFARKAKAQIVTHPIWWTSRTREHPADRMFRFARRMEERAIGVLAETVSPFAAWLDHEKTRQWVWPPDVRMPTVCADQC